jgi:hypothetical protein
LQLPHHGSRRFITILVPAPGEAALDPNPVGSREIMAGTKAEEEERRKGTERENNFVV